MRRSIMIIMTVKITIDKWTKARKPSEPFFTGEKEQQQQIKSSLHAILFCFNGYQFKMANSLI